MLKVVEYLRDFFTLVVDLFQALFGVIGSFFKMLGNCVVFLYDVLSAIPTMFLFAVLALVIVTVLYKILGRETQS